ncbi:MAG: class I SAM-dependent methyltransferase [Chloroflexota bacterium]|nr:class I SAM-dependent methyltransferase [Chloroflexota bacterium]
MSKISDQEYLLTDQYQDASNLSARIQIHVLFSTNKYGWHQWVFDQFDLSPESRILELGCGPGHLWLENLHRIPENWEITLSDLSAGMLQETRQSLCDSQGCFRFEVIDAQSIPFEDESFDAVIANHMLYHVPDRARAFSEIRRVLRFGGRFYASTIGQTHMRELHELLSKFDPGAGTWGGRPPESFLLENGLDQISLWFSRVTLRRYKDALVITEADPLVAYVLSTTAKSTLVGDRLAEFVKHVERELTLYGAIYVTKDSGIFEALRDAGV